MRILLGSLVLGLAVTACSSSNNKSPDGPGGNTFKISGTASEIGISGKTPLGGVTVAAYDATDENNASATSTTAADGTYTIEVPMTGTALNGFVKATKANYMTTYLYPTSPLTADFDRGSVNMLTPGVFQALRGFAVANQSANMGFIAMIVEDAANNPVAGSTISSTPASEAYRYNGPNGLPGDSSVTVAAADGIGYMFNVPVGTVVVNGMKSGSTFTSHSVIARAGAITTTVVNP